MWGCQAYRSEEFERDVRGERRRERLEREEGLLVEGKGGTGGAWEEEDLSPFHLRALEHQGWHI